MTRDLTRGFLAAIVCSFMASVPATAQEVRPSANPVARMTAVARADLQGTVLDDRGRPLAGVVVSAIGSTTAFAVSDEEGRCNFRNLPPGPYLVRAHLPGFAPHRGRFVQVSASALNTFAVALSRRETGGEAGEVPPVLTAGVGAPEIANTSHDPGDTHDHGEMAWRLRHLKRSVLRDVDAGLDGVEVDDSNPDVGSFAGVGRFVVGQARLATSLLSDLPLTGQINLLTVASFKRPQDFITKGWAPSGIAYVSLSTPAGGGQWAMRGVMTQGDLASWILAGSFVRSAATTHRYEAGLSYGMQRYQGDTARGVAAISDDGKNVGAVYAYDHWAITPIVSVGYGAKYARYDYLEDRGLLSPSASVTVQPSGRGDGLRIRGNVARRDVAPGGEEFLPPSRELWLPSERWFSPAAGQVFNAERVEHMEIAVERAVAADVQLVLRAFRQDIDDQIVTLFGAAPADGTPAGSLEHYQVATGGDVRARGWGIGVARHFGAVLNVAVDYAQVRSRWQGASFDGQNQGFLMRAPDRGDKDNLHDVTTRVESLVPVSDTRVFVTYKLNTGFATTDGSSGLPDARFDVQVKQVLPFMRFTNARWEMLVAVRNIFHDDLADASVYDELLVIRPPKRVIGGVTVKF